MATKRDLVEAHAFSRRRLVTAFVSGAPGGREVEPTRPGRTIVGGLALTILLLAGAAIAGVLAGRDPEDWNKPGLLISEDSGALYVVLEEEADPELHSILNITSAHLIFGPEMRTTVLSDDTIADQELGQDIGILGAPQTVPDPSRLIASGWTACATREARNLAVTVSTEQGVTPAPEAGFTVRSEGEHYLIASGRDEDGNPVGAHSYRLPQGAAKADPVLRALGLDPTVDALDMPGEWLRLFPVGDELTFTSFGLEGFGQPVPYADPALPPDAKIGEVVTADQEQFLLLAADGLVELDPFARAVYESVPKKGKVDVTPRTLEQAPRTPSAPVSFRDARWPQDPPTDEPGDPCALLVAEAGEPAVVELATDPTEQAAATAVGEDARRVSVDAGHGAYVVSAGFESATSSTAVLIDAKGAFYPLVGPDTAAALGYGSYDPPVVPDTWLELFEQGVPLSREAALCPPVRPEQGAQCE